MYQKYAKYITIVMLQCLEEYNFLLSIRQSLHNVFDVIHKRIDKDKYTKGAICIGAFYKGGNQAGRTISRRKFYKAGFKVGGNHEYDQRKLNRLSEK